VIPFNLAPGATSAPIEVPRATPIFIVANTTTRDDPGTAYMSLQAFARAFDGYLEWSGVNSTSIVDSKPTLAGGVSHTAGTDMLVISYNQHVTLQVVDANHFAVHNGQMLVTETGFVWVLTAPAVS
jgi:hypothetical protein